MGMQNSSLTDPGPGRDTVHNSKKVLERRQAHAKLPGKLTYPPFLQEVLLHKKLQSLDVPVALLAQ